MTMTAPMAEQATQRTSVGSTRKLRAPIWYRAALVLLAAWGFLTVWRTLAAIDGTIWPDLSDLSPFELPWDLPYRHIDNQAYVAVTVVVLGLAATGFLIAGLIGRTVLIPFVAGALASAFYLPNAVADIKAEWHAWDLGDAIQNTVWVRNWAGGWSIETYPNPAFVAMIIWFIVCVAGIALWMYSASRRRRISPERGTAVPVPVEPAFEVPAGWYQDAEHEAIQRWWDGSDWTDRTRPRPPSHSTADGPHDAPGWYADPQGRPVDRYWTGSSWDERTRPRLTAPVAVIRPPAGNGASALSTSLGVLVATGRLLRMVAVLQETADDEDDEQ